MLYDSELFNNQPLATTLLEAFQSWPFSLSNLARVYVEQPESNRNIRAINNSSAPGKRTKKIVIVVAMLSVDAELMDTMF